MDPNFIIRDADDADSIERARELLREYREIIGIALHYQPFDHELDGLPGDYAPPMGRLLFAESGSDPVGCIALRPRGPGIAEMKRLYIRPAFRGHGLGRALVERIIAEALTAGYRRIVLDTLPEMADAHRLYLAFGFAEIPPYMDRPIPGARFLALELADA